VLRLFRWLIWGDAHLHKWVPYRKEVSVWYGEADPDTAPDFRQQSFRCEHCGKIRIFKV
jgi:hypothetical protein